MGVADSQQITASGGTPPYSFTMAAGTLPPGLSLSDAGVISGTPTTTGSYQFTVKATDTSTPASTGSQPYMLQVAQATVTITLSPATLPDATAEAADSQQITAAGGTPPYSFSVTSGILPPGLSLDASTGVIGGIPTTAASYQFTITATDSSATPSTGSKAYTLQITPAAVTLTLAPATLPDATTSWECPAVPYQKTIMASGGTAPYSFSVTRGTLPPGLSLDPGTGLISGTPTTQGNYTFTITATDSSPPPNTGSQTYTVGEDPCIA